MGPPGPGGCRGGSLQGHLPAAAGASRARSARLDLSAAHRGPSRGATPRDPGFAGVLRGGHGRRLACAGSRQVRAPLREQAPAGARGLRGQGRPWSLGPLPRALPWPCTSIGAALPGARALPPPAFSSLLRLAGLRLRGRRAPPDGADPVDVLARRGRAGGHATPPAPADVPRLRRVDLRTPLGAADPPGWSVARGGGARVGGRAPPDRPPRGASGEDPRGRGDAGPRRLAPRAGSARHRPRELGGPSSRGARAPRPRPRRRRVCGRLFRGFADASGLGCLG
jgi:hypothetical protein